MCQIERKDSFSECTAPDFESRTTLPLSSLCDLHDANLIGTIAGSQHGIDMEVSWC